MYLPIPPAPSLQFYYPIEHFLFPTLCALFKNLQSKLSAACTNMAVVPSSGTWEASQDDTPENKTIKKKNKLPFPQLIPTVNNCVANRRMSLAFLQPSCDVWMDCSCVGALHAVIETLTFFWNSRVTAGFSKDVSCLWLL